MEHGIILLDRREQQGHESLDAGVALLDKLLDQHLMRPLTLLLFVAEALLRGFECFHLSRPVTAEQALTLPKLLELLRAALCRDA